MSNNTQSDSDTSVLTATIEDSKPSTLSVNTWNLVDLGQRGAAKDASEDIVPIMEDAVGEQTLFVLPKGRYLIDSEFDPDGWDRIGVVGRPHAELVVTDSEQTFPACFDFKRDEASAVRIENLTFDFTEEGVGPQAIGARVRDRLLIRDVDVKGRCDFIDRTRRPSSVVYPSLVTEDGVGLVENLNMPDGSAFDKELYEQDTAENPIPVHTWGLIGVNVYVYHKGTLRFRDCSVANFPDAGMYLKDSAGNGSSIIEGGRYWDNGAADVRLGNNDECHGAEIIKTTGGDKKGWSGPCLWLQKGSPVVRDTTIKAYRWDGEVIRVNSPGGTLDNLTVKSSISTRTIRMSGGEIGDGTGVVVQNCEFTSFGVPRGYFALIMRPDVTHRDCTFQYAGDPDESRHLVYTDEGTTWVDCEFDTPDVGLRVDGAKTDVRGCQFNDSTFYVARDGDSGLACVQNRIKIENIATEVGDPVEIASGNFEP